MRRRTMSRRRLCAQTHRVGLGVMATAKRKHFMCLGKWNGVFRFLIWEEVVVRGSVRSVVMDEDENCCGERGSDIF